MRNEKIKKFINDFKIIDYLDKQKIEYKIIDNSSNGQQIRLEKCPFCNNINYKDNYHSWRFNIGLQNKLFICFNCNTKGNLLRFLSGVEKLNFIQIFDKFLYNIDEIFSPQKLNTLIQHDETIENKKGGLIIPPKLILPSYFKEILPFRKEFIEAYKYLDLRGCLNKKIIKKYDIRYSDDMKRIIFPIYYDNKCIAWQGRSIYDHIKPKYLISKGFNKQSILHVTQVFLFFILFILFR